jgi:hypothetical protein
MRALKTQVSTAQPTHRAVIEVPKNSITRSTVADSSAVAVNISGGKQEHDRGA